MHLFYNASQIITKNGYLGRLICHIFGISTVNFGLGVKANGMAFQTCSVVYRFVALLPQSDKTSQNHNEYRMLSSFARTLLSKLHQLLVWIQKTLITQFVQSIKSFYHKFLPRLIRTPGNISSKLSLVSTWHITNGQNDIFIRK